MKESRLYLNFFKKNLFLFLAPMVLTTSIAAYSVLTKPAVNVLSRILEVPAVSQVCVNDQTAIADQAVGLIRMPNIQQELKLSATTIRISAVRFAPAAIKLESLSSQNNLQVLENLTADLDKANLFLSQKFDLQQVGSDYLAVSRPGKLLPLLISVIAGFLIGLFLSLVKTYFHRY